MKRPEQALQKAVCAYLDVALICSEALYFAVPNGGKRSAVEAAIMKGLGVKAGVADLCILWRCPEWRLGTAGFIELKADKGRLSPAQRDFGISCKAVGSHWAEARSVDEVEAILLRWRVPVCTGVRLYPPRASVGKG